MMKKRALRQHVRGPPSHFVSWTESDKPHAHKKTGLPFGHFYETQSQKINGTTILVCGLYALKHYGYPWASFFPTFFIDINPVLKALKPKIQYFWNHILLRDWVSFFQYLHFQSGWWPNLVFPSLTWKPWNKIESSQF